MIKLKKINRFLANLSLSVLVILALSFFLLPVSSKLQESPTLAVFEEVWQTVNDNFFDPKFNGVDWKAMREKYKPSVKQAKSIDEASVVINQMLAELHTSHLGFYPKSQPAYYQLLGIFNQGHFLEKIQKLFPKGLEYTGIGAFTKEIDGKTFITAILDNSSAAQAGLKVGDQILAVDGNPYQPIESFVNKTGKQVSISIQRTPDSNSNKNVTVVPKIIKPTTVFLDAMRSSIEIIESNGRKLGYVHIWSYAGDQYQELLEEEIAYGRLKDADGLILDLRDGWGGATPNYLSIFSEKVPVLTQIPRDGIKTTLDYQWRKPVVMLVNKGTRSGKEILAYGFEQYGIGKVVGSQTAGAVVAARPFLLKDGNLLYLAVVDIYVNGERLEGKGVKPDIEVPFQLEYAQGKDPQKAKAVEVLAEAVKNQNRGA
ncbi:S41 family peptidase [Trichocoleus sp. DQ-A3]|uniref:S41 family peptidase n=1 Tax=Cyanophyceae TaxID=3028117 RepID=UPI0016885D70|nr:S41 family peptidase [Coleofasciculus sp. FACHB-125]MBD1902407.1 PDZ domain-containing protein [Coleofasciculus sp. FACHB-125]